MKKVSNCFGYSKLFPIFAPAILENRSDNAHFDILHDKQKRADRAAPFTTFVLQVITRTLSGEYVRKACPSLLLK